MTGKNLRLRVECIGIHLLGRCLRQRSDTIRCETLKVVVCICVSHVHARREKVLKQMGNKKGFQHLGFHFPSRLSSFPLTDVRDFPLPSPLVSLFSLPSKSFNRRSLVRPRAIALCRTLSRLFERSIPVPSSSPYPFPRHFVYSCSTITV